MRERRLEDFGPYRIVRQLAVGGMAEIYLARQRGLEGIERMVVLKRILERHAHDAEFVTMFLDEARLLAALSHPNIAQVFDVGQVEGTYYLVMEHVRGPTLGKLLSAAKDSGAAALPRREALGVGLAVAEALHYVHERKDELGRPLDIVHRDLNPANVIVSYDGAVKLIDFGIAKAATKVYETRTGVVKGTYGYIAPEQLLGETPVDRRADVFALGILLYEMCAGVHPYDVSDEPNLIDRVLEARYRRPREVRPDIAPELDDLIARCLKPRPGGRPADMEEVIESLAAHLAAQRMVPTQHALAELTRRLVPDGEGPRPLKRLTMQRSRPFAVPPSTRKLRVANTPEDPTEPTRAPEPAHDDPWAVPTVRFDGDGLTLENGAPPGPAPPTRAHRPPIDDDSEEIPTTLMALPHADAPAPRRPSTPPSSAAPRSSRPPLGAGDVSTYVPLRRKQRVPGLVVGVIGALGLLGAGLGAFFAARALAPAEPAVAAREPEPIVAAAPVAARLRIVSEPPGARVHVDGRAAEGVTPLVVTIPAGRRSVWLRLAKSGHLDQEREVSAAVREARFVLPPLAVEGNGGP